MSASMIDNWLEFHGWGSYLLAGAFSLFQIWMFIDAVRRGEWLWAAFIFIGWGFSAVLYYVMVYRSGAVSMSGFELPGTQHRKRIKELQAKIHHLDNAVHHYQLGDIYFSQGKLPLAESCYRAALERDPADIDARAHLGQCLLRLKRPAEARPWLQAVCTENTDHEHGYSLMAYAETLTALGETNDAIKVWQHVTANHSYARAKFQLAELYIASNQLDAARSELRDILADDIHAPAFQRKRDRVWLRRAWALSRKIGDGANSPAG